MRGLIRFDHAVARLPHGVGALLVLAAIAWGAVLLASHFRIWRGATPARAPDGRNGIPTGAGSYAKP
ncbi:MAG TPA: hypothetical protein VLT88_11585 [Desulfosarcina sp.]|nr:hypothetical protein [Desulfosarcina sp.]